MTTIHVEPINDVIEHNTASDDCVCGPDIEYLENGGKLVTHHSLDGRENTEPRKQEKENGPT